MPDEIEATNIDGTISRQELLKRAGVGVGGLVIAGSAPASALARITVRERPSASNLIKIGFISPRTGPLGSFGEPDPFALGLFRKKLAKGLTIKGKHYAVKIIDKDNQSSPPRAGQLAKQLINRDKVDLVLSTSTPETNNPVADACEAAHMPHISTVEPWQAWYLVRGAVPGKPSPFKWGFHMSFGVENFFTEYVSNWNGPVKTNKKVGVMWPNDADGQAVRAVLGPLLTQAGFTIVDPGAYEDGTTDYSSQIAQFKKENCQIFNTFPIPPDFTTFWQQAAQQGYTQMVKIAQLAKTGLFPSQIEASGALGYNLASNVYWHPTFPYSSSVLGLSSKALAAGYEAATKKQWNQQLGATVSLLDVAIAALKASGNPKSKPAIVKAMHTLKVNTTVGHLDWTKNPKDPTGRAVPNVVTTPLVANQWVKAPKGSKFKLQNVIVEHVNDKKVPIGAKLKPYTS
jgi:branched-chain amino acid transport system substrate-binding protein